MNIWFKIRLIFLILYLVRVDNVRHFGKLLFKNVTANMALNLSIQSMLNMDACCMLCFGIVGLSLTFSWILNYFKFKSHSIYQIGINLELNANRFNIHHFKSIKQLKRFQLWTASMKVISYGNTYSHL